MTTDQIRTLLRHPDAQVRSLADWTREARGEGWRGRQWPGLVNAESAAQLERQLRARLIEYGNREWRKSPHQAIA